MSYWVQTYGQIRLLLPLLTWVTCMAGETGSLSIVPPNGDGWPRLSLQSNNKSVVRLEASSDFFTWHEIGRTHGQFEAFPDVDGVLNPLRLYRGFVTPKLDSDDWKNQVRFPDDPLRSPDSSAWRDAPRWIKFAIDLAEPHRVYFQDSARYLFHYDFAVARLERFRGWSRSEFDAVSLRRHNQQVLLGAILFPSSANVQELAVQLVGLDPYPREQVAQWIELVRAMIILPGTAELLYFPTFEQAAIADDNRDFFQSRGIRVSSIARWAWTDELYAPGWALGRLILVPAAELDDYYRDGLLRPDDILLVDAVPASVPPVAGIVTLAPATPNAHVAILAQGFGIPFVYFAEETMREQLRTWSGHEVLLRADSDFWGVHVKLVNVQGQIEGALREALLELKTPATLSISPIRPAGTISLPATHLWPEDIGFVGGKAANFGLLRRAIPENAPEPAIAFTFDLWVDYLNQSLPGGQTLRQVIDSRLAEFHWPPNMARLQSALADIRALIRNSSDFSPVARQEILAALSDAGFSTDRRIRFRSSTNVEDSEQFSGAGLYDSYSGCLGDDLAPNQSGPSLCNPNESQKRGVFRALRRVYASFYNDNAFLERLRHGVDETTVGMAVLAHYSAPDEFELANGVATLRIDSGGIPSQRTVDAQLVTQLGAVSVTNPDSSAGPEVVRATSWAGNSPWLELNRHSTLVPLGGQVLVWEKEYRELFRLLDLAAKAYESAFPAKRQLVLDLEYKKLAPHQVLSIKQIREVPQPPSTGPSIPWLLNGTNQYAVLQGEFGEVFAFHRLKSTWSLQTANLRLNPEVDQSFYRQFRAEVLLTGQLTAISGDLRTLPDFQHRREEDMWTDSWTWHDGEESRRVELRTWLPAPLPPGASPIVFLDDGRIELTVNYPGAKAAWTHHGPGITFTDHVTLVPIEPVGPRSLRQTRHLSQGGLDVVTTFFWPPAPRGPSAGYTAPLQGWVETVITGLVQQPIVLRNPYSQTYHPAHHNFAETFLFDPHLEPGMDPQTIAELKARNIRGLLAGYYGPDQPVDLWIWGLDDLLR